MLALFQQVTGATNAGNGGKNVKNDEYTNNGLKSDCVSTLIDRIEDGDHKALTLLKEHAPGVIEEAMTTYGDLGRHVQDQIVGAIAGSNLLQAEGIHAMAETIKTAISDTAPSPLERLIVERIVCCWLQAHCADLMAAQHHNRVEIAQFYHKQQDRATRRFLSSCKALANVRKLLGPSLQINIAEKQVNLFQPQSS
jgi:hypothetical protein